MRRFELVKGTSSKFWEVEVRGADVEVRFGRIGTNGQRKTRTWGNAKQAQGEADKLVAEKLKEGYSEIGPAAVPAKAAVPARAATPKAPAPAPAMDAAAPPGTFAFSAAQDALFARGWPELRILDEGPITPAKALALARKELTAVDPILPVNIPREAARRILRIYIASRDPDPAAHVAAEQDEGPITAEWLEQILERRMAPTASVSYGGETYDFRLEDVIYLFEAFLGTEVVAAAVGAHLLRALQNPAWWKPFVDHEHSEAPRLIPILGWLGQRMDASRFAALIEPLGAGNPELPTYSAHLRLLDRNLALPPTNCEAPMYAEQVVAFAMQRRDAAWVRAWFTQQGRKWFWNPQAAWVCGADLLFDLETRKLASNPKWEQLRMIDQLGTIKHAGAAHVISTLTRSRSASAAALAWVSAHREWIEREALPELKDRKLESAALLQAALSGEAAPAPRVSEREASRTIAAMAKGLGAKLRAAGADPVRERAILDAAFREYAELRAASGDIIPDAYFTHTLSDHCQQWKADQPTLERWMNIAVEAANAG